MLMTTPLPGMMNGVAWPVRPGQVLQAPLVVLNSNQIAALSAAAAAQPANRALAAAAAAAAAQPTNLALMTAATPASVQPSNLAMTAAAAAAAGQPAKRQRQQMRDDKERSSSELWACA